ncbi:GDSL esterase/lipase [Dichanthelium oligosanthes]|uniref:GDSL esterase/lipase n=1 Tax=Dichanthelium oligosanthes TaxID=888268 RepID=A0A1E5V726_9POAL|nr:GDSL esterase/lipase [Dichanthelium oligosanthes]
MLIEMGPSCKSATTIAACGVLLLCVGFLTELVHGELAPALYVLGDSQADTGNNNHLELSPLRANFPHNGIDYPGQQPTGRFSNGLNFVDFLGAYTSISMCLLNDGIDVPSWQSRAGQPSSIPFHHQQHYSCRTLLHVLKGVNFASGGAGVLDLTNKGQCFSFNYQIERDYFNGYLELVQQLGRPQAMAHLAKSIFTVAIGGNDIILRALPPTVEVELPAVELSVLSPQSFTDLLAQNLEHQLQRLYELGMRRLFFVGAAPIGCVPLMRELNLLTKECHPGANDMSIQYNAAVASLLRSMSERHPDFRYSFDTHTALMQYIDKPEANGYAEVKAACCGLGDKKAMYRCDRVSCVCSDRTDHVFWDLVHPTETTSRKLTAVAFGGSEPLISPINGKPEGALTVEENELNGTNKERLYGLGMRKLFFVGTGPLGCYPFLRQRSLAMECDAEASSLSVQYNAAVVAILRDMSRRHRDFQYSFLDQYTALLMYIQEPEANGFADAKAACCALANGTATLI